MKTWLPIALFCVLWLDLVRLLSGNWEARDQYAYGWFVPFFALGLLFRRWLDRPLPLRLGRGQPDATLAHRMGEGLGVRDSREVSKGRARFLLSAFIFLLCLLLLPLRVIFEINTDWPLIAWAYTLIVVCLTLYAFHLADPSSIIHHPSPTTPSPWVRHFFFPVAFILVALVWPWRIEHALTQNLMQVAASLTVEIIGWFGVPAFQRGNLIEIDTGVLGVDEACSGIRSFQSTLMAALFLGELYRLRVWARAGLVLGGLVLAFGFNVIRTLILTWQANQEGISAIDKWHDPAGFTIAIACFFCLWAIAALVKRKAESRKQPGEITERLHGPGKAESRNILATPASDLRPLTSGDATPQPSTLNPQPPSTSPSSILHPPSSSHSAPSTSPSSILHLPSSMPRGFLMAIGLWSLLCILATEVWYRAHANPNSGVFHWNVAMPANDPMFERIELPPRTLKLLSFDEGASGKWREDGKEWTAHFFRWRPRSVESVIYSRAHRPEVCLPASGLQQIGNSELVTFDVGPLQLPFRKYTFEASGQTLHVFFCQWEDGAEQQSGLQSTKQADRLQSVLSGRRLVGQQTFQLILLGYETLEQAEQAVRLRLPQLIRETTVEQQGVQNPPSDKAG